jgi:oxygen-independent coproporphyrinogen-3 oxidase
LKEINITTPYGNEQTQIDTIYFGGGTPSLLQYADLQLIIVTLQRQFDIHPLAEITLEANPDDITLQKLQEWLSLGINRLSLGIQSFNEAELKWMNRAHNATEALDCIAAIKQAGFSNYSIDLIYGSPLLSDEQWQQHLQIAINMQVPHLSCYALTIEEKTALHHFVAQQKVPPTDSEKQARHFLMMIDALEQAGYEHYEISNLCLSGMQSRHNSSYWQGTAYYGFGPAAHAFDGKARRWNIANNAQYISALASGTIPFEEEILTPHQRQNEYVMTSLRTANGIDLTVITQQFGNTAREQLLAEAATWITNKKLIAVENYLRLSRQGKLFADGIAASLFI